GGNRGVHRGGGTGCVRTGTDQGAGGYPPAGAFPRGDRRTAWSLEFRGCGRQFRGQDAFAFALPVQRPPWSGDGGGGGTTLGRGQGPGGFRAHPLTQRSCPQKPHFLTQRSLWIVTAFWRQDLWVNERWGVGALRRTGCWRGSAAG